MGSSTLVVDHFLGVIVVRAFNLRFLTDANQGGTEKISICGALNDVKAAKATIRTDEVTPESHGLVAPSSIFYVKGWTRSFCAWVVMLCSYESPEFLAVWPRECQLRFDCRSI